MEPQQQPDQPGGQYPPQPNQAPAGYSPQYSQDYQPPQQPSQSGSQPYYGMPQTPPNYNQPQPEPQPAPDRSDPRPKGLHPMVVLQPGERVVAVIKRHPFGILSLYAGGAIALAIAIAFAFILLPRVLDTYDTSQANTMIYFGLAIVVVGMALILAIATSVYWQNQWTITTDSITQISQKTLFTRQVSQLSMDNLEDVTVDQDGIIPHLFNFGTLKVETAGERSKFQFPYCPNPTDYARRILEAHEQFLDDRRNVQNTP